MNLKLFISVFLLLSVNYVIAQNPGAFEEAQNMTVHQFSKRIKKAKNPVLVCFETESNLASIQQKNILNEIYEQYQLNLDIQLCDLERNPKLAAYFNLDSLPVLILYVDAYPLWLIFGKVEKEELMKCLEIYGIKFKERNRHEPEHASAVINAR
ncbi:MAG: hypothetical protein JNL60_06900 [Bacteroidia bacterium]|nr:hypothetical protein [Bacteroidia bacterium]